MATTVTIDLRHVARGLSIPLRQVQVVVELLDEGNTVPFITRYRKDQTGGLDEEQIRQVQARLAKMRLLADRKQTILRSIEAQDKLTEKLAKQIQSAGTTKRLEDLYLPYKPKKQTLATLARSRGLEPLAREILEADPACADLDARAADFVNADRQVPTAADALLGAGHILAEQFSERVELRQRLREILQRTGKLVSTRVGDDQKSQTEKPEQPEKPAEKPAEAAKPPEEPAEKPAEAAETPDSSGDKPAEAGETPDNHAEKPAEAVETSNNPGEKPAEAGETSNNPGEKPAEAGETPDNPGEKPAEAAETPDNPGDKPAEAVEAPDQPDQQRVASEETSDPPQPVTEEKPDSPGEPLLEGIADQQVEQGANQPSEAGVEQRADQPAEASAEKPSEPVAPPQADQPAPPTAKAQPRRAKDKQKRDRLHKREFRKKKAEEKKIKAFHDYFDYSEEIKRIPPHRVLAINRGERARVLRVKGECDLEAMYEALEELLVPPEHPHGEYLCGCGRDALTRLILPALEREIRRELTDRAEAHAVGVFARNLRNLLLQPPVWDRRVLAVDPGYKSGCKLAALDQFGNLLEHDVIFLVGRPERRQQAQQKAVDLICRFQLSVVVIGNGTACRECEDFFGELVARELKDREIAYVIVNEAGASVYSTSRVGREEFPDYDASLRGAISIGRRLQDPLSELVKIDAANIGVGLYQHDVKAKHLRASLDEVVESCVNYVGVDVNTASPALLRYVSGLNQLTARRVYEQRLRQGPFRSREQLKEVTGLGETTFVQAAGFLKITASDNPLDATWIHPESYDVAARVLSNLECSPADLSDKEKQARLAERVAKIDLDEMAKQLEVGTLTLKDILAQLARPGRDPREDLPTPVFKRGVLKLEDLTVGMELTGTVLNVVDFGCFVDIGMHDSGLVHVSQLADKYVRDPHEVVAVGDIVKVWVLEVDKQRRRVSLAMVQPGTQRPRPPRRGAKPAKSKQPSEGGDARGERPAKTRDSRRPRPKKEPRGGKGPPRRKGPSKSKYRPKSRPKPEVPLTDGMKCGKEPMRTFGDLAQFFEQEQNAGDGSKMDKAQTVGDKAESRPDEAQTTHDEAQSTEGEVPIPQDESQTTNDQLQGTQDAAQPTQEQDGRDA